MHPDPEYPVGYDDGNQNGNLLYGTEYQESILDENLNQDGDAACAVCQSTNPTVMVQWGRQTCSNGYTLEYAGLVMSTKYNQHPMRDICVDREKAVHMRSHGGNQDGALLYPTEMEQGAADEVLYPPNREVGCAVCSKNEHATGCDGVEGSSILFDVCGICVAMDCPVQSHPR